MLICRLYVDWTLSGVVHMDIEQAIMVFAVLVLLIVAAYGISVPILSALGG